MLPNKNRFFCSATEDELGLEAEAPDEIGIGIGRFGRTVSEDEDDFGRAALLRQPHQLHGQIHRVK